MKIMRMHLCIVIIVLSVTVLGTAEIETEDLDEKKCISNLSPHQITTSYGTKVVCAHVSSEKLKWDDAKFRCNLLFAQLTHQVYFKSLIRMNILKKGLGIIWVGIRRRNNFFATEYPSKLFREADTFSSDYWGYHWSDGEPGIEDCVVLNVSSGSLQTHSCDDILPFVCDDGGRDVSALYESLACPDNFNISFPLSSTGRTCISLQKPHSHENAEGICAKNNGRLASFQEYTTLFSKKFFSPLDIENFWIEKRNKYLCEITGDMKKSMNKILPVSCALSYPFVCVKDYKIESMRVHLSPNSIKPLQSDTTDATDLLTCDLETGFFDNFNLENDLWFQWYKDNLPLPVNSYVIRLSFTGDALKRDSYISDIASRQGYYHCEVQLPGSSEKHSSSKMKFFYSDIATYVVEIRGIKKTNDLDFSHHNFYKYMDDLEEASMSNVLERVKTRYPEAEWDFMSKSILNGEIIMKIVVYIYKTGVVDFDMRMACEELKDAFEGLYSVPIFMEDMSVILNCEEYPVRNGYMQVIKSLHAIENKLNRLEDKQEYILEKLQDCQQTKNIESRSDNNNFNVELFLEVVDDLKRLENHLLHKTPETMNSENEQNQRERNELENKLISEIESRFSDKSKEFLPEDVHSKPRGFQEELNENRIYYPENEWNEDEPASGVFKDL